MMFKEWFNIFECEFGQINFDDFDYNSAIEYSAELPNKFDFKRNDIIYSIDLSANKNGGYGFSLYPNKSDNQQYHVIRICIGILKFVLGNNENISINFKTKNQKEKNILQYIYKKHFENNCDLLEFDKTIILKKK